MKKIFFTGILFLLLLIITAHGQKITAQTILCQDNSDSYTLNQFPPNRVASKNEWGNSVAGQNNNYSQVTASAIPNAICPGQITTLSADGASTYNWSNGLGAGRFIVLNPVITTTYTVTGTDINGSTSFATVTVTVNDNPAATASNTGPYNEGQTIQFKSSGGASYIWTGPDEYTSSVQNPTLGFATTGMSGIYKVTVTNDSGCTATAQTIITVNPNPASKSTKTKPYSKILGNNSMMINKINDTTYIINNKVVLNRKSRTISFPAIFTKTNAMNGVIELVLCTKYGKAYESLLITDVTPIELQTALLLMGYKSLENKLPFDNENIKKKEKKIKKADSFFITVQWADSNKVHTQRIENFIWDTTHSSFLKPVTWFFNGLLTNEQGKINSDNWTSMIVTNYDYSSILSLNYGIRFNGDVGGYRVNTANDNIYYTKVDKYLLGKEINLIIKPAIVKKNLLKRK